MPIIKSAIKRARQAEVRRQRNLKTKTAIKQHTRAVMDHAATKDVNDKLNAAYSQIDKAVKTGLLHRNTAARRKSRLAHTIAAAQPKTAKKAESSKPAKPPEGQAKS